MFSNCKIKRDNLGNSQIIGTQIYAPGDNAGKIYFCLCLKMMKVIDNKIGATFQKRKNKSLIIHRIARL